MERIFDAVLGGLLLGPVTLGVGGLWTWWLPPPRRSDSRWIVITVTSGRALVAGVVLMGLVSLGLGLAGCYTAGWEALALALLVGLGHVVGIAFGGQAFHDSLKHSWPGALVVFIGSVLFLLNPVHSEWIVGGLDPGVYLNEAAALDQQGTFTPSDDFFHDLLSGKEQAAFTRSGKGRTERFPGVAVGARGKTMEFEFFRFFPAVAARFHRVGGISALVRVNGLLGVFVLLAFTAVLLEYMPPRAALVSTLALMLQPVWIYHLHVPIVEMLQLLLLCGVGMLLPACRTRKAAAPALALVLAAGVLTHFSFLPAGAMLVCAIAWVDLARTDRRRVLRDHVWLLLGLAAGWVVDLAIAPVSFIGWGDGFKAVAASGIALGCAALGVDLLGAWPRPRTWLARPPRQVWAVVATLVLAFLGWSWVRGLRSDHEDAITFVRLLHYIGVVPLCMGVAGGMLAFRTGAPVAREAKGLVLFWIALTVTMILWINEWTIPYYPWATRRYLICCVPLVAVGFAMALMALWRMRKGRIVPRALAVLLLALTIGTMQRTIRRAWVHTEHVGAYAALSSLAEHIGDRDIIVSDHPKWGTPLALIFGKRVLNARHFYRRGPESMDAGLETLRGLISRGHRVRFLTSTVTGLSVFPREIPGAVLQWSSPPLHLRTVIQHRRSHDFQTRESVATFRLYGWDGKE